MDKKLHRHFCRDDIQIANKYMKRCPISLDVREKQMKTWMRQHYIPVGTVNIKHRATLLAG